MAIPPFTSTSKLSENSTLPSLIRFLNSLVTNLRQIFTSLLKKPQLDAILLTNITVNTTPTIIAHTLGKTLTGWQITRLRNSSAIIFDLQDQNPNPQVYLVLQMQGILSPANSVVVDILVF